MASVPLVLTLEPLLPTRSPRGERRVFRFGYQLRLPAGPIVEPDDPLLAVFGAETVWLEGMGEYEEAIQSAALDPGARLSPVCEALDEDGDPVVGVWDAEELHRGGVLPFAVAARVAAALDHGLDVHVLSLEERRTALDDLRVGLLVLVSAPSMVRVKPAAKHARMVRPARAVRRRVVLLADGGGQVRWWDPSGDSGPAEIAQLPVSMQLREELQRFGEEHTVLIRRSDETHGRIRRMEVDWARKEFTGLAMSLWRRVRSELGRDYAVGFLGPGMERPVWSPAEMHQDDEDYESPF